LAPAGAVVVRDVVRRARRVLVGLELAARTAAASVAAFAFEDDFHFAGDGDEQGHDRNLALADMLHEDDGDAGLAVDEATGERHLAIKLRRHRLKGADVTRCDERGAH
jgi:hypothetical protein